MPPRRKTESKEAARHIDGQLAIFADAVRGGEEADWTAADQVELGALVVSLCASDAGLMLRSAERGRAVAVGLFLAGRSQWTTCREQHELLAVLEAAQSVMQGLSGAAVAPAPTATPRKRSKRS